MRRRAQAVNELDPVEPWRRGGDPVVLLPLKAMDVLHEAIIMVDRDRRIIGLSGSAEALFACSLAQVRGRPVEMLIPRQCRAAFELSLIRFWRSAERRLDVDMATARRIDGSEFPAAVSVVKWQREGGDEVLVVVVRNQCAMREVEQDLHDVRAVIGGLVEEIRGATLVVDADRGLLAANYAARSLLVEPSAPLGSPIEDLGLLFGTSAGALVRSAVTASHDTPGTNPAEELPPLGQTRWTYQVLPITGTTASIVHFAELRQPAVAGDAPGAPAVDPVTGLCDRRWLDQLLASELSVPPGSRVGLVMVQFPEVTEVGLAFGGAAEDALARSVTTVLRRVLPAGVAAVRFAADVVAVLVAGCSVEELEDMAASLSAGLQQCLRVGDRALWIDPVVGAAVVDVAAAAGLVRRAALALESARRQGRHRVVGPDESPEAEAARAFALRTGLWGALRCDLVAVHYQPVVELVTQQVVGLEAVARWEHPGLGEVTQAELHRAAGRAGARAALGSHLQARALGQLVALRAERPGMDIRLCLDINAAELRGQAFGRTFLHRVKSHGAEPQSLCLEIADDGEALGDPMVLRTMRSLAGEGVSWAIERFAAGPSSLESLLDLPISMVKLAPRFAASIDEDPRVEGLVRSVASLCTDLDLLLLADGVTRRAQVDALIDAGCGLGQGPFYSLPVDSASLAAAIERIELGVM